MAWAPVAAAGLSSAGDVYASWQDRQNSREGRKWQEKMSNTSYQRAVQDARAAGLNPALLYSQGGASTPSGNMPAPTRDPLGGAVNSAMAVRKANQELNNLKAQEYLTYRQAQALGEQAAKGKVFDRISSFGFNSADAVADWFEKSQPSWENASKRGFSSQSDKEPYFWRLWNRVKNYVENPR